MKMFSKKGVLLFAGAMAVCAFVLPSMASASSWGPIGNADHVLDTPNIGFSSSNFAGAPATSSCTSSSFTAVVLSAADVQIRAGAFGGLCTASGAAIGTCTATATPTRFPWTATAVTTSNIQIHGVHIDIRFEQPPGQNTCVNVVGADLTLTGTLTNARYLGPGRLDLQNAHGLVSHSGLGPNNPVTALGQLSDTSPVTRITVTG